jgi:hypothetical protein
MCGTVETVNQLFSDFFEAPGGFQRKAALKDRVARHFAPDGYGLISQTLLSLLRWRERKCGFTAYSYFVYCSLDT